MKKHFPQRMTFQWHLTDQCNYRCKHCYQDSYTYAGVSFEVQLQLLEQMKDFVRKASEVNENFVAHINFTGGEPFIRTNFLDLLKAARESKLFSFGILSNGFLLEPDKLQELKTLKPSFIQISLEGNERVNDSIRGRGSYSEILEAIKAYHRLKIPVMISFTANAENYKQFPAVVKIARRLKVYKVWTDRYLPSSENDPLEMTTEQAKELFNIILHEQNKSKFHIFSNTQISANRALQFLVMGGKPYKCSAGESLLTILPNGDLLPCRRLPIKVGNLLETSLLELYQTNFILNDLRKPLTPSECAACYYNESCNGGLKCLSYIKYHHYVQKDPNCWL